MNLKRRWAAEFNNGAVGMGADAALHGTVCKGTSFTKTSQSI